jgi:hypothetical protein
MALHWKHWVLPAQRVKISIKFLMSKSKSDAVEKPQTQTDRKEVEAGDYLYLAFFLFHIPISLLFPPQFLLPTQYIPQFAKDLLIDTIKQSKDPILKLFLDDPIPPWILAIFGMEILQVPFFVYAVYCLYTGRKFKKLGIAYCVHVLTTNVICIAHIISQNATIEEIVGWNMTYAPFWMIPLLFLVELVNS